MSDYGEVIHHDPDVDGYCLTVARAEGIYILDLSPKDAEYVGDDGVHLYLTGAQLAALGVSLHVEAKRLGPF